MTSGALPGRVASVVAELVGRPSTVESLGGMSGARVMRATGPAGSVVVKADVSPREAAVYRSLSPVLTSSGVRIPALYRSVEVAGETWLLLEDIGTPLPRGRWLADPELLTTLHRLHRLPLATLDLLPSRFQPQWREAMTDAALPWLGRGRDRGRHFVGLREEAGPLFEPVSVITGDPNPLNWGVSGAGELVLMDWERIGLGHPAIDVAITIPGLPTLDEFDQVAAVWRMIGSHLSPDAQPIQTRDLVLAKVWTVIELLADTPLITGGQESGPIVRRQELAVAVAGRLPDWLRRVI